MDSGEFYRDCDGDNGHSEPARHRCAWIIGGAFDSWLATLLHLRKNAIEVQMLDLGADLREIVKRAELEGGVIVIDLSRDIDRGPAVMEACYGYSATVPLIPVVAEPSMELAQRLRNLHAFCLVPHPLDAGKVCAVLEEAFSYAQRLKLAAHSQKKRILIIDDDKDYRRSVQALLVNEGHEVFCATSGAQGLEMAVSIKPDLVVLDVMMENTWAGYEVSQTLKFQSGYEGVAHVPIVMVSSIEEHPAEVFSRSGDPAMVGPDVYFTKPLDVKRFIETVRLLLKTESAVKVQE